jgi:succinate dehydrogenase / fumarate reductase, cytochrome b subunit
MHRNPSRPLSPHLTIWHWGPHMIVSIVHRATGVALSTAGAAALVWWLCAAASGPQAYATFTLWATSWIGIVVGVGLAWSLFQHALSGLRHFVMDIGAGFALGRNRFWASMTLIGSLLLTILFFVYLLAVRS